MRSERLTFPGATGATLSARLDRPLDGRVRAYALFAHCFTCSKDLKAVGNIARALAQEGIATLRFDFTGLGESAGEFAETSFTSNVDDLVAAAAFLEDRFEPPQILLGHSLGGAAVLQAAARIPFARAVATIAAPSDPRHIERLLADSVEEIRRQGEAEVVLAGRRFRIRREFLDNLEAVRMRESIRALRRPLLIFHSPVDEIVGIENAARIYEAAKHPKSFISLDDADHLLMDERDSRYVGSVLAAWAHRYLDVAPEVTLHELKGEKRVVARIGPSGFRTDLLAGDHALVSDEPKAVGGTDVGPTPYDLLVAGLGACTTMTLRLYADRKRWPLEEVIVRLHHRRVHAIDDERCESQAARIDRIERELELVGDLDDEQRARLLEIANRCPVHRTLDAGVHVVTTLAGGPAGGAGAEAQAGVEAGGVAQTPAQMQAQAQTEAVGAPPTGKAPPGA